MSKQVTMEEVATAIDSGGWEVRSYSGRYMYGKRCIGVTIDDMGEALKIGALLVNKGFDYDDVIGLGDEMRWDNMGRSYVLYWPSLVVDENHIFPWQEEG